jgi:hypothetical protein
MYRIAYDPERWHQAQQYVLRDLDGGQRLIAHLYLTDGSQVVVARAWIEQAYVTHLHRFCRPLAIPLPYIL